MCTKYFACNYVSLFSYDHLILMNYFIKFLVQVCFLFVNTFYLCRPVFLAYVFFMDIVMFRMVAGYSSDGSGHPGNSQNPAVRLEGESIVRTSGYPVVLNPAEPEGRIPGCKSIHSLRVCR